ncbi:MAG: hypothetical protein ACRYGI_08105 [Janthinobacterium lividum]
MIPRVVAALAAILACPAVSVAVTPSTRQAVQNVCVGGYVGFQDLSLANTRQLRATGRGCLYLHGSAVGPATAAADRAVLSSLGSMMGIFEAGENDFFLPGNAYDTYLAASGWVPRHILLNTPSVDDFVTSPGHADLIAYKAWVDQVRTRFPGISVGPVMTPGGGDKHFNQSFATSDYWKDARLAAIYGGSLAIDIPSRNFFIVPRWAKFLESQIRWANSAGVRSDVILSPGGSRTFMADTQAVLARLVADGAVPTSITIENYEPGTASTIADETAPESLNAVALWVALHAPR